MNIFSFLKNNFGSPISNQETFRKNDETFNKESFQLSFKEKSKPLISEPVKIKNSKTSDDFEYMVTGYMPAPPGISGALFCTGEIKADYYQNLHLS